MISNWSSKLERTTMTAEQRRRPLDPDRLASLEEERDFLLRSLDDLESERAAGDLDAADYEQLKDDYTVRAADSIRAIGQFRSSIEAGRSERSPRRRVAAVAALLVFAVGAGLLLARSAGERGVDDQLSGSIEESVRERVLRCQQMGTDPSQLIDSLGCFDDVLDQDPQNVEALAYRGWYVVLASGTAQQAGQTDAAAELLLSGQTFLNRAVEVDPTYPDARAFRAIVFERLGEIEQACAELTGLLAENPPPMIEQLVTPLSERLVC
jgi:tetratricopeptide (TPR) repeat protein